MKLFSPLRCSLCAALCLSVFVSCSKQPNATEIPAEPEKRSGILAYQESVNAVMERMEMHIAYDEAGERKTLRGSATMSKQRFATVEHATNKMKRVHLRRWARVHVAEITDSSIPRGNEVQESPLSNARLEADRKEAGWRMRLTDRPETPENIPALQELEKVESSNLLFYHGQTVREGESWQVPAPAVARWFGNDVADMTGSINLRVGGREPVNEVACSVIDVEINTIGKMTDDQGKISNLELIAKGKIWRAVELGEDLKVDINGTVKLSAKMAEQNAEVIIEGPIRITESRKLKG